jgi:hypothetical protein
LAETVLVSPEAFLANGRSSSNCQFPPTVLGLSIFTTFVYSVRVLSRVEIDRKPDFKLAEVVFGGVG